MKLKLEELDAALTEKKNKCNFQIPGNHIVGENLLQ